MTDREHIGFLLSILDRMTMLLQEALSPRTHNDRIIFVMSGILDDLMILLKELPKFREALKARGDVQ